MKDLKSSLTIPVYFDQVLINLFPYETNSTKTIAHRPICSNDLKINIQLKRYDKKGKIFGLDYSAKHEVRVCGNPVGEIEFRRSDPVGFDKIIDTRGLTSLMRKNYQNFKPKN